MRFRIGRLSRGAVAAIAALTASAGFMSAVAPPASATASFAFTRIAGATRFGTAQTIATTAFPAGAPTAIIATGFNFPDALAGNYLAGTNAAPILLVNSSGGVPTETLNALSTLKTKNVILLGQTGAIGADVAAALASTTSTAAGGGTLNVTRLGGATRYDTMKLIDEAPVAPAIAPAVGTIGGKRTAILVSGNTFPDALSFGPIAWAAHFPVVLTDPTVLSPQAATVLKDDAIQQVLVGGGDLAIMPAVVSSLATLPTPVTVAAQFKGADRSDTSALVADYAIATLHFSKTHFNVASGDNNFGGADALALGALGGNAGPVAAFTLAGDAPVVTLVTNSAADAGKLPAEGSKYFATATAGFLVGGQIPLPDVPTGNAIVAGFQTQPASLPSYQTTPAASATPQQATVSTVTAGVSDNRGFVTYSVSGLPTTAGQTAFVTLFPCVGPNSPTLTNGSITFAPTTAGAASSQAAGEGTTTAPAGPTSAYVASVNGVPTAAGTKTTGPIGVVSGSLTFVLNSTGPDCAVPVTFTSPTSATTPSSFLVDATGKPLPGYAYGLGQATQWNAATAPTGTAGTFFVIGVNTTAHTFQACSSVSPNPCFTFNDGNAGTTYAYTDPNIALTQTQFEQYLSAPYTAPTGTTGLPASPSGLGDTVTIAAYNGAGPNAFTFGGAGTTGDEPVAPTGLIAVAGATGGVTLTWTGVVNPDVTNAADPATAGYNVYRATVTGTAVGAYTLLGTAPTVPGTTAVPTPPVTFTDTTATAGTTYSYAVAAKAGTAAGGVVGPSSTPVQFAPAAGVSAATPLSVSTGEALPGSNITTLTTGDSLAVTFNGPVSLAAAYSLTVSDNTNSAVISPSNSTAVLSNGNQTVTYTLTSTPISTPGPVAVAKLEALRQVGVTNANGAWNLPTSATDTVATNPATAAGANPALTRVFAGTNANAPLPAGPTINSVTPGATGVAAVSVTCTAGSTAVIYDGNGNQIGSAVCTGAAQSIASTVAITGGVAIGATQQVNANTFESMETLTNRLVLSATPTTLVHGSATTSAVTATVTNATGAPVAADAVTFAVVASGGATCGAAPTGATTNASGVATSSYTVGSVAGTCTITATDASLGISNAVAIVQS